MGIQWIVTLYGGLLICLLGFVIQKIRGREELCQEIFNRTGSGLVICEAVDGGGDFIYRAVNPAVARIGSRSREAHIGGRLADLYPGVEKTEILEAFRRVWRTGRPEALPAICYQDDRIACWVETRLCRLRSGEVLAVFDDVTDQKAAEAALRAGEQRFRAFFDNSPVGLYIGDVSTRPARCVRVNRALAEMFGLPPEAFAGKTHQSIFGDQGAAKEKDALVASVAASGCPAVLASKWTAADGREIHVHDTCFPIPEPGGRITGVGGVVVDQTEKVAAAGEKARLEASIRQSQKMESIGVLAGGIAHDFNNILFPIIGYAEMLADELPPDSRGRKNIQEILKSSGRAKDLVRQILAFGRKSDKSLRPVLVQPLVKEALKLLRATLPVSIEITSTIRPSRPVLADPTQIHQVLLNLCTNAQHAMSETGGTLCVEVAPVEVTASTAGTPEVRPGAYLTVRIRDTGCGMDQVTLEHLFEPYYTTKPQGVGTGLGLAVVHQIVKDHGGSIDVRSEPGRGSCFTLLLPLAEAEAAADLVPQSQAAAGYERILLVDDEPSVVEVLRSLLESFGYSVTARYSALDALALFKNDPSAFDLVVTDIAMPHLPGDRLASEMLALRPGLPIVLCTGYTDWIDAEKVKQMGLAGFLTKPVDKCELARAVREALDPTPAKA